MIAMAAAPALNAAARLRSQAIAERRERARQVQRRQNDLVLEKYRREQAKLAKEAADHKRREKVKFEAVKRENEAIEQRKRREAELAGLEEVECQKTHAAMLEAQEQARVVFYEKKMQRQEVGAGRRRRRVAVRFGCRGRATVRPWVARAILADAFAIP